jgi:glycopeptide antibiotics resistance protein
MLGLLFIRELPDISGPGFSYWEHIRSHIHLIPFTTTSNYIHLLLYPDRYLSWMDAQAYAAACGNAISNLGGNVILFIPLGYLLPRIFSGLQKLWKTALCAFVIMTCVEILQLFTLLGYCDADDLILNTIGAAIGYGLHKLVIKSLRSA